MANNARRTFVGKPSPAGGILYAPVGTPLPTDEEMELNAAFVALGYQHKDGFKIKPERSTATQTAWGTDMVDESQESFAVTATFIMIETLGVDANKIAFGAANVSHTPATSTSGLKVASRLTADDLDHNSWVVRGKSNKKTARWVIPDGKPVAVDEIAWSDSELEGYSITLSCSPDENGVYVYRYTCDGVTTL
ncbi:MAG: hypothetical protein FWD18_00430 [Micrococcales bacterium]|nr:hypothetical protein [Micrococcales bacterium]